MYTFYSITPNNFFYETWCFQLIFKISLKLFVSYTCTVHSTVFPTRCVLLVLKRSVQAN